MFCPAITRYLPIAVLLFFRFQKQFSCCRIHIGVADNHPVVLEFRLQFGGKAVVFKIGMQKIDKSDTRGRVLVKIACRSFQQERLILCFCPADLKIRLFAAVKCQVTIPKEEVEDTVSIKLVVGRKAYIRVCTVLFDDYQIPAFAGDRISEEFGSP